MKLAKKSLSRIDFVAAIIPAQVVGYACTGFTSEFPILSFGFIIVLFWLVSIFSARLRDTGLSALFSIIPAAISVASMLAMMPGVIVANLVSIIVCGAIAPKLREGKSMQTEPHTNLCTHGSSVVVMKKFTKLVYQISFALALFLMFFPLHIGRFTLPDARLSVHYGSSPRVNMGMHFIMYPPSSTEVKERYLKKIENLPRRETVERLNYPNFYSAVDYKKTLFIVGGLLLGGGFCFKINKAVIEKSSEIVRLKQEVNNLASLNEDLSKDVKDTILSDRKESRLKLTTALADLEEISAERDMWKRMYEEEDYEED